MLSDGSQCHFVYRAIDKFIREYAQVLACNPQFVLAAPLEIICIKSVIIKINATVLSGATVSTAL